MYYELIAVAGNGLPDTYLKMHSISMKMVSREMVDLGMSFSSEAPGLPDGTHLSAEDFSEAGPVTEQARRFAAKSEAALANHDASDAAYRKGIPLHKLTTNDGWHVTAQECREALAAYESSVEAGADHPVAFSDDVIPFLRAAARGKGFRVW